VLYLGDDLTDEDAFGALGPNDVGIKVGAGPTRAPYRVPTEQAALDVLALLSKRRVLIAGSHSSRERTCRADT
jgi:trehalose-6-phosphatase